MIRISLLAAGLLRHEDTHAEIDSEGTLQQSALLQSEQLTRGRAGQLLSSAEQALVVIVDRNNAVLTLATHEDSWQVASTETTQKCGPGAGLPCVLKGVKPGREPSSTRRGGQSSNRYQNIHDNAEHTWAKLVAEVTQQQMLEMRPPLEPAALLVAGFGTIPNLVLGKLKAAHLPYQVPLLDGVLSIAPRANDAAAPRAVAAALESDDLGAELGAKLVASSDGEQAVAEFNRRLASSTELTHFTNGCGVEKAIEYGAVEKVLLCEGVEFDEDAETVAIDPGSSSLARTFCDTYGSGPVALLHGYMVEAIEKGVQQGTADEVPWTGC